MNVNYRVEEWLLLPWYLLHSIPSSVACAVFTQISENNTEEGEAVNFLTQPSQLKFLYSSLYNCIQLHHAHCILSV